MPIRTDGSPSRRNSHCQPSRPCTPFKPLIIKPEIGFPMMPAMGRARKNDAGHKTRLRKSKQKARNVELGWRRDKHRRDRRKAPQEHNAIYTVNRSHYDLSPAFLLMAAAAVTFITILALRETYKMPLGTPITAAVGGRRAS